MSPLTRPIIKFTIILSACALLGWGVSQAGLLPPWMRFVSMAHATAGDSLLPKHEPIERRPPDREEIQHWYEDELAKEQARNDRNLRKIDLRFQEQWPSSGEEQQRTYDRARQREMDRYERELRELEREYKQKFRR